MALRHKINTNKTGEIFQSGDLKIDFSNRTVLKNGKEVKLTPTEYSILLIVIKYTDKVVTQTYILKEIWGPTFEVETQYLRVYILQLRKKIEDNPSKPEIIITEPGVGYRFVSKK